MQDRDQILVCCFHGRKCVHITWEHTVPVYSSIRACTDPYSICILYGTVHSDLRPYTPRMWDHFPQCSCINYIMCIFKNVLNEEQKIVLPISVVFCFLSLLNVYICIVFVLLNWIGLRSVKFRYKYSVLLFDVHRSLFAYVVSSSHMYVCSSSSARTFTYVFGGFNRLSLG